MKKILRILDVKIPRMISHNIAHCPEGEESEVTVSHVVILSEEQKLRHNREL